MNFIFGQLGTRTDDNLKQFQKSQLQQELYTTEKQLKLYEMILEKQECHSYDIILQNKIYELDDIKNAIKIVLKNL